MQKVIHQAEFRRRGSRHCKRLHGSGSFTAFLLTDEAVTHKIGAMRSAIYARVSTADQTCEMQLRELREYAARRGWELFAEYVDRGWSGAKANRPELDRLMADARQRRFDAVLVWKLDRWGRSIRHAMNSIQELACHGVRFLAITQNIDTDESNPMSRFMLHIMAAFAELERELIRERVVSGVRAAKANGKRLGTEIPAPTDLVSGRK